MLTAQQSRVVGYLPYYRFYLIDEIHLDKLTHLCIAFANPDEQGYLSAGGADLRPVVQRAHRDSVQVLISLAGGAMKPEWAEAWKRLTTPWKRTAFISKIMLFVRANGLDGVDLDLEWKQINQHYSGFILELRDSLSAQGKLLTAALPGTHRYKHLSDEALMAFDFVNLMAYDLTGPWTAASPGPHSPYPMAISSLVYWKNQGMPASRLVLGIPLYGWDFSEPGQVASVPYGVIVASNPAYAHVDQIGKIYYNGIVTAVAKAQLAKEQAGGIMLWELSKDAYGEYSLLAAAYEALLGVAAPGEMIAEEVPPAVLPPASYSPAAFHSSLPVPGRQRELAPAGFQEEAGLAAIGTEIFGLEIEVLPNPFQDSLKITNNEKHVLQLVLTDIKGRPLYETSLRPNATISWETASFPPGQYIVSATQGDKQVAKRVVKSGP